MQSIIKLLMQISKKSLLAFISVLSMIIQISAPAHATENKPRDIANIKWKDYSGLLVSSPDKGSSVSRVNLDVDNITKRHIGQKIPNMKTSSRENVFGVPYYFLGIDPEVNGYLSDYIAMCIDIFHTTYNVEKDSDYYDLTQFLAEDLVKEISYTINAGVQIAAQKGLKLNTNGSIPLVFTTEESIDTMLAAQIYSWYIYAKNVKQEFGTPLPNLHISDFHAVRNINGTTYNNYDLSSKYNDIQKLVKQFRAAPYFDNQTLEIADTLILQDPAIANFDNFLDLEKSTPGFEKYLDIDLKSGSINITKKEEIIDDITLVFNKEFIHTLGKKEYPNIGLRGTHEDQTKMLINSSYTESYTINLAADPANLVEETGAIELEKVDSTENPLAGAQFTIFDQEGNIAQDITGKELVGTTGDETKFGNAANVGSLHFPEIPAGNYVVQETLSPAGYEKNTTQYEVTVTAGETAVVNQGNLIINYEIIVDPDLGNIALYKADENLNYLAGAEFKAIDSSGNIAAVEFTDSNGYLEFRDLEPGEYLIQETKAPLGFVISEEANIGYEVTVIARERVYVSSENSPIINNRTDVVDTDMVDTDTAEENEQYDISLNEDGLANTGAGSLYILLFSITIIVLLGGVIAILSSRPIRHSSRNLQ